MEAIKNRTYFAQKYKMAEADIAPEFLPLLIAFDDVNKQNKQLIKQVRGSISAHHHYYEDTTPAAAFLLRWGWTTPLLIVTVLGMLWGFFAWHNPDRDQLKELKTVVHYDETSRGYIIDAKNYELVSPGGKEKGFRGIRLILPDSSATANQAKL